MFGKTLPALFALILLTILFNFTATAQEESVPAAASDLIAVNLPRNAARLSAASVPAEVNQALERIVASGGSEIRQGGREVLAWTNNYKKSNAPVLIKQLTDNLQTAGWTYEVGGENDGITVFGVFSERESERQIFKSETNRCFQSNVRNDAARNKRRGNGFVRARRSENRIGRAAGGRLGCNEH